MNYRFLRFKNALTNYPKSRWLSVVSYWKDEERNNERYKQTSNRLVILYRYFKQLWIG
jgi:hypothetical protein